MTGRTPAERASLERAQALALEREQAYIREHGCKPYPPGERWPYGGKPGQGPSSVPRPRSTRRAHRRRQREARRRSR